MSALPRGDRADRQALDRRHPLLADRRAAALPRRDEGGAGPFRPPALPAPARARGRGARRARGRAGDSGARHLRAHRQGRGSASRDPRAEAVGRPLAPDRVTLPGPFPVGRYAKTLRDELRKRARVQLIGEVTGLRQTRKQTYFELRDSEGAVPCTIWANELDRLELPDGALHDGAEFVAGGGPDYF